jgi:hypothetical protein
MLALSAQVAALSADVCGRMLTYADVCWRMLALSAQHAEVHRVLALRDADVC